MPQQWNDTARTSRRHDATGDDQRGAFERDRDRILYASAFRRLAGITQIVRAGESDVFHNRQQHSLKVAQVGRRLAERLVREQKELAHHAGMDPEVVEAACLAHDLGHPPFGHIGEEFLNEAVVDGGDDGGFEGNAQTFRILTKLAVRFDEHLGLDLTRAVLAASIKYPWMRDDSKPSRSKKWGAYWSETEDFNFVRSAYPSEERTAEAALMDWADDIAYSVHDLEDFHRCGAVPWRKVFSDEGSERLIKRTVANWFAAPSDANNKATDALERLQNIMSVFPTVTEELYEGERNQRFEIRVLTSQLIGRYIRSANLHAGNGSALPYLVIGDEEAMEVRVLKQITRDYIIESPSLAAQQVGQKRILAELFELIFKESKIECPRFLPKRLRYLWKLERCTRARFTADCIASLTEAEAIALGSRLKGTASGSVLDPIVR